MYLTLRNYCLFWLFRNCIGLTLQLIYKGILPIAQITYCKIPKGERCIACFLVSCSHPVHLSGAKLFHWFLLHLSRQRQFTVKPTMLLHQHPLLAQAPPQALYRILYLYFLYSFSQKGPPELYKFQSPSNLNLLASRDSVFIYKHVFAYIL